MKRRKRRVGCYGGGEGTNTDRIPQQKVLFDARSREDSNNIPRVPNEAEMTERKIKSWKVTLIKEINRQVNNGGGDEAAVARIRTQSRPFDAQNLEESTDILSSMNDEELTEKQD
ncbi:hypothetical protein FRC12_019866 [Ceratobasidium sp. 428]|nr:hypothetical protein FRC12_019866 [Ceratobasidium sp. 428]